MVVILQEAVQLISARLLPAIDLILHRPFLDFLFLLFAFCLASQVFPNAFLAVERFGSSLAKRRRLCIFLLPVLAIVLRLSLLWAIPVPHPEIHDEFSYLLAADTFAHGRLTNPPHPVWIYLDTFHVNGQPTYMSIYPPAQGAVLALGQLLGHPWIGVLLSVAAMTGAVLWALQGWFPPRWALLGGILVLLRLAIFSYWINSYWGGAVAAIGGALVFGALPRIMRSCHIRDALLLGWGVSILANSRPFEGLIFCLPVIAVLVAWMCGSHGPSWSVASRQIALPFCAVMFLCACFMGYYNLRLTGHPSLFPHDLYTRSHMAIPQFAWQKNVASFHFQNPQLETFYNHWLPAVAWPAGRPDSLMHIARAFSLHGKILVNFFAHPEFIVAALAAPWILRDRRMRVPIAQLIFCFSGFVLAAYFLPHYAAPLTATTFALIVQGLRHVRRWHIRKYMLGLHLLRATVVSTLFLSPYLFNVLVFPFPSMEYRQRIAAQLAAMPGFDLVVVRYSNRHSPQMEWVYNDADIDHAKIVWAREIPRVPLQPLLDYFHDRRVWIVEPDENPPKLSPYVPPSSTNSRENRAGHPG
jgi:hypothetical protein